MFKRIVFFSLLLGLSLLAFLWYWQPGLALHEQHAAPQAKGDESIRISWFGVSAVLLRSQDHAIFIDPFFSRPGPLGKLLFNPKLQPNQALIQQWLARAGVKHLDAVLVSHSHYDHAMDAGVVARLTGARLIGSASTLNVGRGAGLPEAQLQLAELGERIRLGDFVLSYFPSAHAGATGGRPKGEITQPLRVPAPLSEYRQGGTFSILLEHPAGNILHHGSAGFVPGALAGVQADVVLLGVALIEDLPTYLANTVQAVGARRVYPLHWDDFSRPLDEPLKPLPLAVRLDRFYAEFPVSDDLQLFSLPLGQAVGVF